METFKRFAEPVNQDEQGGEGSTNVCIFADGCWEVAIDNSGSTAGSILVRDNALSILEATKRLLSSVWCNDMEVIAWNSGAVRARLPGVVPSGGTSPACIFPILRKDCRTLLITTDGEIGSHQVTQLEPLVSKSGLVNVVAVYVSSSSDSKPSTLNLPVFAPFMNHVVGRFVICHYDGEVSRVLLKHCNGNPSLVETSLPDPPVEIHKRSAWEDFPLVSPCDLLKMTVPQRMEALGGQLRSGSLFHNSLCWNLLKLRAELTDLLEDQSELTGATLELLQDLIPAAQTSTQRDLLRESLQIWYKHSLEQSRRKAEDAEAKGALEQQEHMNAMKDRADELLETLLQEHDLPRRKALQQDLAQITTAVFHHEESSRRNLLQARRGVEAQYNSMAEQLAVSEKADQDYSLLGISGSLKSNRARRAVVANAQVHADDGWDLEGAHVTECDICADTKPQALLAIALSRQQTEYNTGDYALNDAFCLGSTNSHFLPTSSLCVFCASFLVSRNKDCPYTRQKIATILPLVKYNKSNFKRLADNLSHWLFAGKQVHLEWQALLAILDAVRIRGGSAGAAALDFLEQEYVPHIRVNFEGIGAGTRPLLVAIDGMFRPARSGYMSAEAYLQPLRNKNMESISILARIGIRFGNISVKEASDVINRMLMKTIVGRALGWCKEKESNKVEIEEELPRILESDLYDISVGFPIKGTGRILSSLADSEVLSTIFDKDALEMFVLKPLATWPQEVHQVSLKVVTVLLYKVLTDFDYQQKTESFFFSLSQSPENPLDWLAFATPSAIEAADVHELLAQLNQDVHSIEEQGHKQVVPCFSPALMLAPPVVCCGSCGMSFILPQEIKKYLMPSSPAEREELAEKVRHRRSHHFQQVFKSGSESGMVDKTSGHSNMHRAVATVMWPLMEQQEFDLKAPTRCMMLQVLAYFRRYPKGGQLYAPQLLERLAAIMFDYLLQTRTLADRGDLPAHAVNHNLSFRERLSIELDYLVRVGVLTNSGGKPQTVDWLKVFPHLTLESHDPLVVEELTRPVLVEELLRVTYTPKKRKREVNSLTECKNPGMKNRESVASS